MEKYNNEDYQAYMDFLNGRKPKEREEEEFYQADMHIHSEFSFDSSMTIEDIIKNLKSQKVKYIGISDHVEFASSAPLDVVDTIKKRNELIDKLSESYDITVLKGLEISEPHNYQKEMEYLKRISDIDYIIGSVHQLNGKYLSSQASRKNIINKYFEEVLKMIKYANIDILGHLDYLKRYKSLDGMDTDLIYQILEILKFSNIALEVNTSGIRRCGETFPNNFILEEYARLGGKRITLGSDAHEESELYASVKETSKSLKELKLDQGIIINHQFKKI